MTDVKVELYHDNFQTIDVETEKTLTDKRI